MRLECCLLIQNVSKDFARDKFPNIFMFEILFEYVEAGNEYFRTKEASVFDIDV